MKKIFIILLILISFSLLACKPDDKPQGEKPREYEKLSYTQYERNVERLGNIDNYIGSNRASGYLIEFDYKIGSLSCDFEADIDIRDSDDVKMKAKAHYEGLKDEQSGGNNRAVELLNGDSGVGRIVDILNPDEMKADIFLRGGTLYIETLRKNITEHDSLNLDNSLSALANSKIGLGDVFALIQYEMPPVELLELMGDLGMFSDKVSIEYCEAVGHYIVKLDYSGGDVDDTQLDAFKLVLEMYVMSDRVVELNYDFTSAGTTFSLDIEEEIPDITFPDLPESYKGTLLDELEEMIQNQDIIFDDFIGVWSGKYADVLGYKLTINNGAITLEFGDENVDFDEYTLYFNQMAVYGEFGSGEGYYVFRLNRNDNIIIMTLPDTAQVILNKDR